MEEMIARWIRETDLEYYKAKNNQNVLRMNQMHLLRKELVNLKAKLLKF